jgi:IclR family transcriptional regulator, acetate operon repressor
MSTLDKTLQILEFLARRGHDVSLTELAAAISFPKSGVHRLLVRLVELGFVQQNDATRDYALTMKLPGIGFAFLASSGLTDACLPIVERTARACGEFVRLAVVSDRSLVWVLHAVDPRAAVRYESNAGGPVEYLHATASGIVWLSTLPEAEAVQLVLKRGFDLPANYGKNAVRSIPELLRRLAKARKDGFVLSLEDGMPGVHVVAVPIRNLGNPGGPILGTVTAAGPAFRLPNSKLVSFLPALREAAQQLSEVWPTQASRLSMEARKRSEVRELIRS